MGIPWINVAGIHIWVARAERRDRGLGDLSVWIANVRFKHSQRFRPVEISQSVVTAAAHLVQLLDGVQYVLLLITGQQLGQFDPEHIVDRLFSVLDFIGGTHQALIFFTAVVLPQLFKYA